jgi:hypothetical protein
MLTGSVCIVSKIRAKMSTLHAVAPIPAFMAGSMRCLQNCATIVALAFQGIGLAFNTLTKGNEKGAARTNARTAPN